MYRRHFVLTKKISTKRRHLIIFSREKYCVVRALFDSFDFHAKDRRSLFHFPERNFIPLFIVYHMAQKTFSKNPQDKRNHISRHKQPDYTLKRNIRTQKSIFHRISEVKVSVRHLSHQFDLMLSSIYLMAMIFPIDKLLPCN